MSLDATLRPTAKRLIAQYGKTVTLVRAVNATDYDTDTGSSSATPVSVTIKAVVDAYSTQEQASGLVQRGDLKLTIADMDPAPTVTDSFTIDGLTHGVVRADPIFTGELVGIYEVQARRR